MKPRGPKYLMWYDDDRKVPVGTKIQEAIEAYTRRFATTPNVVLVNSAVATEVQGIEIRSVDFVRPNTFWVGFDAQNGVLA